MLLCELCEGIIMAATVFDPCVGWWFVNVDDFNEGWVPATYLEPLYGSEDISVQKLDPGEGTSNNMCVSYMYIQVQTF